MKRITVQQQRAVSRRFPTPPTTEEFTVLLAAASSDLIGQDVQDVVNILSQTGMRCGEICELRWSDIDFENRSITINSKKNQSVRTVPIAGKTIEALRSRHERQPNTDYVMGSAPRTVLNRVTRQINVLCDRIGSRRITLHSLRHLFALRWMNSGGSILPLALIMGHSAISTTFRTFLLPSRQLGIASSELARVEYQAK